MIAVGSMGLNLVEGAYRLIRSIDFYETLFHGLLSFLLFAGALQVDLARQAAASPGGRSSRALLSCAARWA